jgi:hypothetical protein
MRFRQMRLTKTRLAKSIATVSMVLSLALCLAGGALAQAAAPQTAAQKPAAKPAAKPKNPTAAKPATTKAAMKPAPSHTTPKFATAKPPAAAAAPTADAAAGPNEAPGVAPDAGGPKRDPFVSLVNDKKEGGGPVLPPGKAGLVVSTVRVDGTVKSGSELIAVVSNPDRHVYFVRQGDQLYDGSVERIDLDGVTFHEDSKDAFGKPVVREVTKRIYASAGEQQ